MRSKLIIIILNIFIFLIGTTVSSQNITQRIDSIAKKYATNGFNGNILYSKNNKIVFRGNYGFSDIDNLKQLNDSTIFELASLSKQFTAVAIVQLVEREQLDYNTKVSTLIQEFPYLDITIEHLLRHQSGLPEKHKILSRKYWKKKKMATNKDVIQLLNKHHFDLAFKPGTKYDYNNTGYVLLASIIEKVSHLSYKTYIINNIFKPASMRHSRVYSVLDLPENYANTALAYTYNNKKKRHQKIENDKNHLHVKWMSGVLGDRGIYASTIDLEKWKQALRNNVLISEKSKQKMFSVDAISPKYGFGFAIYQTQKKGKWVYHNGSWSGYKTTAIYLPQSNEYLVILSNNRYEETYKKMENDIYNQLL